jgi:hypothetical protein
MSTKNAEPAVSNVAYKFPIRETGSLIFAFKGAKVFKASLIHNNTILSILRPTYNDDWTDESVTPLSFFGEKPFFQSLTIGELYITLEVKNGTLPTIMISQEKPFTWDDVGDDLYITEVIVGSDAGEKTLNLTYVKDGACGFTASVN